VRKLGPLAVLLALSLPATAVAAAAPGSPDRGFGKRGTVTIAHPFLELIPEAVAVRRRGILLAAQAHLPNSAIGPGYSFFRLSPDGRLDRRFGDRGRADAGLPGARVAALLPDGRMAAARGPANFLDEQVLEVVQLDASGTRDAGFGERGRANVPIAGLQTVVALRPHSGGALLVAATSVEGELFVIRLDASGRLDPAFGSGGRVLLATGPSASGVDLAVRPDGRFVAVFVRWDVSGQNVLTLAAFGAGGSPDTSFGPDGTGVAAWTEPHGRLGGAALGPGGRLGVAGTAGLLERRLTGSSYAPDGSRSFHHTVSSPRPEESTAVAFDRAGRLLLAGHSAERSSHSGLHVVRLTAAGRVDRRFGRRGRVVRYAGTTAAAEAIAVQADGRLLVAGWQLPGGADRHPIAPRRGDPGVIRLLRLNG
jgi:uncharacterized delta-60 repeat protein